MHKFLFYNKFIIFLYVTGLTNYTYRLHRRKIINYVLKVNINRHTEHFSYNYAAFREGRELH